MKRLAAIAVLCMAGCVEETANTTSSDGTAGPLSATENEVYTAVVDSFGGVPDSAPYIVVLSSSLTASAADTVGVQQDSQVTALAISRFLGANLDTTDWTGEPLDLGVPVILISYGQLDSLGGTGGPGLWTSFYQAYPDANGYHAFSRVGFSADSTAGILMYHHAYNTLGADFILLSVVKTGQRWRVHRVYRWITA